MKRAGVLAVCLMLIMSVVDSRGNQAVAVALPGAPRAAQRLPLNVVPEKYELYIAPDLQAGSFKGNETLTVQVLEGGADRILLNSKDLDIESAMLATEGALRFNVRPDDILELTPAHHLGPGTYTITIMFKGKLNDKLVGFYRSTFKDKEGKQHTLAVTQMEPADARRMFPCFDEPSFKATFGLAVQTKAGLTAVTNAPLQKKTENADGTVTYVFESTPKMSSYLVALAVGEFEATDPVTVEGVPIRVWSVKGKSHLAAYSRDQAARLLPFLTSYFGIPYPWKKLDLLAIPDFEAGAMENPGCITFRETLLLIDPVKGSSRAKESATSVIAHEMAHLWFGDLVTMKWWDDLWLNEAFATWMATKAVDAIEPEWEEWKDYASDRSASMTTDALKATRAIHKDVNNPEQAHEMFDVITYEKGASILRMLERFVSEKTFQQGVHDYLTKHSFSNATTGDLWDAIAAASGKPVREIMNGWVHQPGYPLLTLSANGAGGYAVQQNRYLMLPSATPDKTVWQVPVGLRAVTSPAKQSEQTPPQASELLTAQTGTLLCAEGKNAPLVIANAGGVGYYRTLYPQSLYTGAIAQKIQALQLDPAERLALLDDTWSLAQTGKLPIEKYLDFLAAFRSDKDEMVWSMMIGQIEWLDKFVSPANRHAYEKFIQVQLASLKHTLGWEPKPGETQPIRLLRAHMLTALGTIGQDRQTIATARKYYEQWIKSPSPSAKVNPDLLQPVTSIVAYNGDQQAFDVFKSKYEKAATPEEEHRNLFALSEFRPANLVGNVLDMSISGQVRTQDAPHLLGSLLGRRDTNERAWQFVESHWKRINELYPEEMVPHVVSNAGSFTTARSYERVKAFVSTHRVKSGESTVARMLERVQINVRFKQQSSDRFNAWLRSHYGNS